MTVPRIGDSSPERPLPTVDDTSATTRGPASGWVTLGVGNGEALIWQPWRADIGPTRRRGTRTPPYGVPVSTRRASRASPRVGVEDVPTPVTQRNAVSEGLAIGLVVLHHDALPDEGGRVDDAFGAAWQTWRFVERFPRVCYDVRAGLRGSHVATRATRACNTRTLFWARGNGLKIQRRDPGWDVDDPHDLNAAVAGLVGEVPLSGWVRLAEQFLKSYLE